MTETRIKDLPLSTQVTADTVMAMDDATYGVRAAKVADLFPVQPGNQTLYVTGAGARTQTLPAGPAGFQVSVKDADGTAAEGNITVLPSTGTIDGAGGYVISTNYGGALFEFDGTNWFVLAVFGAASLILVAEAPTFSPPEQTVTGPITVTLLTDTLGGVPHYTTDGSPALPSSPAAPNPVTVAPNTKIRAITTASGYRDSAESSATYPATVTSFPTYFGVSALDMLTPTQVKALNLRPATNPFGTYPMSGSSLDYFYYWWPATFPSPSTGNGFTLVGSGSMVMAALLGPFVGGPVNGWYYAPMTIDAQPGFLFRTYYPLGNGSPQNVIIQ